MAARSGFFLRWLRGAWPAWLALVLLLVVMFQVVQPRVDRFMDYWYSVPTWAAAESRDNAATLRPAREQAVMHRAWLVGTAPVALLFLLQLVQTLFSRRDDDDDSDTDSSDVVADMAQLTHAEKTLVREAELTLVRQAVGQPVATGAADVTQVRGNAADVTQLRAAAVSLDDGEALHIGPAKRYRVERLLGSGGMGSVHAGFDQVLQRRVALKSLHMELARDDQEQIVRFRREAYALAGLSHQHIVPVYDLFEEGNEFWMVLEYLPGGDLDALLQKAPPTIKQSLAIIKAVAKGLDHAHDKGFIHRDVKPMNILISEDGLPKLVDFGIAKGGRSDQAIAKTQSGLSLGSPTYMSPEQARGESNIDRRADIYSLGITFYKMLTGDVPFKSDDVGAVMRQHITQLPRAPRELNPLVSEQLNGIVLKMLEKHPDDRFQSLKDFIVALDELKVG